MKRKKAENKATKVHAKPLRELWERLSNPDDRARLTLMVKGTTYSPIDGVPLPPDLENALRFFAREETKPLAEQLTSPPVVNFGDSLHEDYEQAFSPIDLKDEHVAEIQASIKRALRIGFNLALLRYADELKHVPEVAALIAKEQARAETARRNGKVRAKKAAPRHKAICKRFRELRKTVPKATARYLRIAREFNMDEGSVGRIVREYSR